MKNIKKYKKIFVIFAVVIVVLLGRMVYDEYIRGSHVKIGSASFGVEIVSEGEDMQKGLSGRDRLDDDSGMLFVLPEKIMGAFWMKDMNFSIDIIWINNDMVVGFDKNLEPEGSNPLNTYRSNGLVDHVLEVQAGEVDRYNIKIGDKVKYYGKRR